MKRTSIGGRLLAFLLAVLMTVGAVPVMALGVAADDDVATTATKSTAETIAEGAYKVEGDYRIVMLDCGRKYFTVSQIKTLIDILERNGYNQLQLSFGNDGFRFLLDDMTLTYDDDNGNTKTLDSATVKQNFQTGNTAEPNDRFENTDCLTESEMDEILLYAGKHKIEIVPMINMPGHAYALLYNSGYAASFKSAWGTKNEVNTGSTEAVNFAYAVLEKYATYFKDRGVRFFNFGADEGGTATTEAFVLGAAETIYKLGLIPRCFNDVFNGASRLNSLKKLQDYGTQICFWAQYSSPNVTGIQTAEAVAAAGYTLINTNQNWYYVVNSVENGINYETVNGVALQLPNNAENNQGYADMDDFCTRTGSVGVAAVKDVQLSSKYKSQIKGSMFCLWFDQPKLMTADQILSTTDETGAGYQLNVLANVYWPEDVKASSSTEWSAVNLQSADTYYEDGTQLVNGGADTWLTNNRPNGISGVDNVKFRGWAGTKDNEVIAAFGYSIDGSIDAVWDTSFIKSAEAAVTNAAGSNAKRYEITVDLSNYPESETHTLTLLVKTVTGKVYKLSNWGNAGTVNFKGNLKVVGNSTEAKGRYMDAFKLADIHLTGSNGGDVMGQLNTMGNTVTIDAGVSHDTAFFQGWIGFGDTRIEKIGYTIDGSAVVWEGGTINRTPEAGVTAGGGSQAIRLTMTIPTADLAVGTHTISVVLQLADGTNVSYSSVKVVVEDENSLPKTTQTIERFVTSQFVGNWTGNYVDSTMYGQHKLTFDPADAYSQDGVELLKLAGKKGTNENGNECWYWKGTVLTETYKQGSNQYQAHGGSADDMTGKGTDFYYIRFWQGKWSVKNSSGTWVDIQSTEQVVAYYMQLSVASKEINVTFRDYAQNAAGTFVYYPNIKNVAVFNQNGDDGYEAITSGGAYPGEEYAGTWTDGYFGVGSAVVYPNGSLSLTEKEIWNTTLFLFYDKKTPSEGGKLRCPGILKVYDSDDYVVTKITITRGHHVAVKHGYGDDDETAWKTQRYWYGDTDHVKWNKKMVGDNEWYDEETLWTRQEGVDYSSGILLDADKFEPYRTTQGVVGEAYLLLFYVEPVLKEDDLKIVYMDDSTLTPTEIIQKGVKVQEGNTFLNSLTIEGQTGNWSAGQLDLASGKTVSIKNITDSVEPINYDKLSLVPGVGDVDTKYVSGDYYYTKAEISDDGKTLYLHYQLKDSLKVQYWYDPIDGSDPVLIDLEPDYLIYVKNDRTFVDGIAVDGTVGTYTAEQLTALIKEGHSFTILGLTTRNETADEENVTIYTALADVTGRINTASQYDDFRNHPEKYSFVEAKLSEDGKLLTLHYTKKVDLKVIWYDDAASEAITEDPNFARTPEETFEEEYDPEETVTVDGKTVETDLDKVVDPEDKDKYEDHYFDRYEVTEDGTTLIVHYKKKVKLTVNYYDMRRTGANGTGNYLFYTTDFDGKADAKWNGRDQYSDWTAQPFEGDIYTAYVALADLMSKNGVTLEEPYNINGMYSIHDARLSDDGLTLDLYYMYAHGTTLDIVWIDDSKTADDNEIMGVGISILDDSRYYFTEAQRAAIDGKAGNVITVINYVLATRTFPTNLGELIDKYPDSVSSDYASDSYYFVQAELSNDNKTLELHYNIKQDFKVIWQDMDSGYQIHMDDSSDALLGKKQTVEWNGLSLSDGSYTAEKDLTNIEAVKPEDRKYYEYVDSVVDGNTLILRYRKKTTSVTIKWIDDSENGYVIHTENPTILDDEQYYFQKSLETTITGASGASFTVNTTDGDTAYWSDLGKVAENYLTGADQTKYTSNMYGFVEAKVVDGKTLELHYTRYKQMNVYWMLTTEEGTTEFWHETAAERILYTATWDKPTYSIILNGETRYTAETALDQAVTDWPDEEFLKPWCLYDTNVDGDDLYLYYKRVELTVIYYAGDTVATAQYLHGYFGYGKLDSKWVEGTDAWSFVQYNGETASTSKTLSDVFNYDPYGIKGAYTLAKTDLSADGLVLKLYYVPNKTEITIKWIDDSANGYVIDMVTVPVIDDDAYFFTEAQRAAINGLTDDLIMVQEFVTGTGLSPKTYNANIQQLASTLANDTDKATYSNAKYYFVNAELADSKTLELHYNLKRDFEVIWKAKDTDFAIHRDMSSETLLDKPATVSWNGLSLSDGSYTAETDLSNLDLTELGEAAKRYSTYYEYTEEFEIDGTTLILYYAPKTVKIVVNRYDQSILTIPLIHTTGEQTVTLEKAEILRDFDDKTGVNIDGLLIYPKLASVEDDTFDHDKYNDNDYYFVRSALDEGKAEEGVWVLDIYYNKYKTMTVHWVERLDKDTEIGSETIENVWATGTWNPTTFAIDNGNVTYTASQDISGFGGDYEYYSYITHEVRSNDLYLYYGYETVYVEWWDLDGNTSIYRDKDGYKIGHGKDLSMSEILTGVTVSGLIAELGTDPTLVDWKDVSHPIYQDLADLHEAVGIKAMYLSGLYSFVKAELSSDKKTLTLYYDVDTSEMQEGELSYVLDYGLPVQIEDVRSLFYDVYGIRASDIDSILFDPSDAHLAEVSMDGWSLTYALWTFMSGVDTVQLTAKLDTASGAAEAILTIHFIPANVMYYEDNFGKDGAIDFVDADCMVDALGQTHSEYLWHLTDAADDLIQRADLVGSGMPYGHDPAYTTGLGFSAGAAMSVTVPAGAAFDNLPTFEFTFSGTGFDIISRTGFQDGRIGVVITNADGEQVNEREYGVILRGDNELYQVPVMSVEGLAYGEYIVTVTVYPPMKMIDRESQEERYLYGTVDGATFVLDGIRIYDPVDVSENSEHEDAEMVRAAYAADAQVVVDREEIRNLLINEGAEITVTVDQNEGGSEADLNGFAEIGPNNEVYLAPGQSITIELTLDARQDAWFYFHALGQATEYQIEVYEDGDLKLTLPMESDLTFCEATTSTDLCGFGWYGGDVSHDVKVVIQNTGSANAGGIEGMSGWIALTDLVITEAPATEDAEDPQ